jgi:hypothetical protein
MRRHVGSLPATKKAGFAVVAASLVSAGSVRGRSAQFWALGLRSGAGVDRGTVRCLSGSAVSTEPACRSMFNESRASVHACSP